MYTNKFGLQFFGKELSSKEEFANRYHIAMKSGDYIFLRFKRDSAYVLVKY